MGRACYIVILFVTIMKLFRRHTCSVVISGVVICMVIFMALRDPYSGDSSQYGSKVGTESHTAINNNKKTDTKFSKAAPKMQKNQHDITLVTMYINIGEFKKGDTNLHFSPKNYRDWMKSWSLMTNPVVAFFDDDETFEYFRQIRAQQPAHLTNIVKINKTEIAAFDDLEKISEIYKQPGYPKYHPNTVVPEYSCAMNAKYDALQLAIERGYVKTPYIAWLDIGLFRNLAKSPQEKNFTLQVPDDFNSSCISMSEVRARKSVSKLTPWEFIKKNVVWVAGGFIVGTVEVVKTFSESYKVTLQYLLDRNMSSTDQQVIMTMYSPEHVKDQRVDVKTYSCKNGDFGLIRDDATYFCLAYICKDAAERRMNATQAETHTTHKS